MKIEKYKPKYHHNPDNCGDNCEKDCEMECPLCRATPYDTKLYYSIEGTNDNIVICNECYEQLKKLMVV